MAESQCNEVWRPVVGYEGRYEVSSSGAVRSSRTGIMRPAPSTGPKGGYLRVIVYRTGEKRKTAYVHRLIAAAFIGPQPDGHEVHHVDGNKTNNAASNLRYVTHVENCAQSPKARTAVAKLTNAEAAEVRRRSLAGERVVLLAAEFHIAGRTVRKIRAGETYRNV